VSKDKLSKLGEKSYPVRVTLYKFYQLKEKIIIAAAFVVSQESIEPNTNDEMVVD